MKIILLDLKINFTRKFVFFLFSENMEQGRKRVRFKEQVQVIEMYTWTYAYRETRKKSMWLNVYIDRNDVSTKNKK